MRDLLLHMFLYCFFLILVCFQVRNFLKDRCLKYEAKKVREFHEKYGLERVTEKYISFQNASMGRDIVLNKRRAVTIYFEIQEENLVADGHPVFVLRRSEILEEGKIVTKNQVKVFS